MHNGFFTHTGQLAPLSIALHVILAPHSYYNRLNSYNRLESIATFCKCGLLSPFLKKSISCHSPPPKKWFQTTILVVSLQKILVNGTSEMTVKKYQYSIALSELRTEIFNYNHERC